MTTGEKTNYNPWGLTPAQVRTMDAICTHGCHKLAAKALGLTTDTIESHARQAKKRMGVRTPLQKYLEWDRWRRGAGAGGAA